MTSNHGICTLVNAPPNWSGVSLQSMNYSWRRILWISFQKLRFSLNLFIFLSLARNARVILMVQWIPVLPPCVHNFLLFLSLFYYQNFKFGFIYPVYFKFWQTFQKLKWVLRFCFGLRTNSSFLCSVGQLEIFKAADFRLQLPVTEYWHKTANSKLGLQCSLDLCSNTCLVLGNKR